MWAENVNCQVYSGSRYRILSIEVIGIFTLELGCKSNVHVRIQMRALFELVQFISGGIHVKRGCKKNKWSRIMEWAGSFSTGISEQCQSVKFNDSAFIPSATIMERKTEYSARIWRSTSSLFEGNMQSLAIGPTKSWIYISYPVNVRCDECYINEI